MNPAITQFLNERLETWLQEVAPNGQKIGGNYILGSLDGDQGASASVALEGSRRGLYKDFASGEKASRNLTALFCLLSDVDPEDWEAFTSAFAEHFGFPIEQVEKHLGEEPKEPEPRRDDGKPVAIGKPKNWDKIWTKCRTDFPSFGCERLAAWRGFSLELVEKLYDFDELGWFTGPRARAGQPWFAIRDLDRKICGIQYVTDRAELRYIAKSAVHRWILNRWGPHFEAHIIESRFDCLALCDRFGCLNRTGVLVICTLGAGNGARVKGLIPDWIRHISIWCQTDQPKANGKIPSEEWLSAVLWALGREASIKRCPVPEVDWNDMLRKELSNA